VGQVQEEAIRILEGEKEFFKGQLPELLREHADQWALVKDRTIHGFFRDGADAFNAGVERFGPHAVFLVVPVRVDFDKPVEIPALATGLMYARL
jgi:hypothetical protein